MNAAQLFAAIVSIGIMAAPFALAVDAYRRFSDRAYGHVFVAVGILAVFLIGPTGVRLIHSLGASQ